MPIILPPPPATASHERLDVILEQLDAGPRVYLHGLPSAGTPPPLYGPVAPVPIVPPPHEEPWGRLVVPHAAPSPGIVAPMRPWIAAHVVGRPAPTEDIPPRVVVARRLPSAGTPTPPSLMPPGPLRVASGLVEDIPPRGGAPSALPSAGTPPLDHTPVPGWPLASIAEDEAVPPRLALPPSTPGGGGTGSTGPGLPVPVDRIVRPWAAGGWLGGGGLLGGVGGELAGTIGGDNGLSPWGAGVPGSDGSPFLEGAWSSLGLGNDVNPFGGVAPKQPGGSGGGGGGFCNCCQGCGCGTPCGGCQVPNTDLTLTISPVSPLTGDVSSATLKHFGGSCGGSGWQACLCLPPAGSPPGTQPSPDPCTKPGTNIIFHLSCQGSPGTLAFNWGDAPSAGAGTGCGNILDPIPAALVSCQSNPFQAIFQFTGINGTTTFTITGSEPSPPPGSTGQYCVTICPVACGGGAPLKNTQITISDSNGQVATCNTGDGCCCTMNIGGPITGATITIDAPGYPELTFTRDLTCGVYVIPLTIPNTVCCGGYIIPYNLTLTDAVGSLSFVYYPNYYYPVWYGGHSVQQESCTVSTPGGICVSNPPSSGPVRVCYQMICYAGQNPTFALQRAWSWVYQQGTLTPIWYQDPSGFTPGLPCVTAPPAPCGSPLTDTASDSENPSSSVPFAISFSPAPAPSNATSDPVGGGVVISA